VAACFNVLTGVSQVQLRICTTNDIQTLFITYESKVNVKVTLVQALGPITGRTAHRGSRGIALPFLDHGTRSE